jgi:hypothetical protein
MCDHVVNHAIERIMTDEKLFRQVVSHGSLVLAEYDLTDRESADIVAAVSEDARAEDPSAFAALRMVARFDPLFAAASATSTKSG